MSAYFQSTTFNLYCAGVYEGKIRFAEKGIMHAKVDARRRTQMQENVLQERTPYILPFAKIKMSLVHYAEAIWQGDEVTLGNGDLYARHVRYTAFMAEQVGEAGRAGEPGGLGEPEGEGQKDQKGPEGAGRPDRPGKEVTSQVWAMRKDTALDIVTVDGRIIAFVAPNRYGMEVLVAEGYEALTPLVVYEDPLLSKPEFGVNDLGTFLIPMRDDVRLATDVYLPEGFQSAQGLPTILIRTCYDRNLRKEFFKRWANKGYAVVNQDVRGRADSEGELVPFYYERDDSADTIDWIVSQEWSNGDVGMWGASYLGYVVTAASTSGHRI